MFLDALHTQGLQCPFRDIQANLRYETIETPCCALENRTSTCVNNNKYFSFFQINHETRELHESSLRTMECGGENYEPMSKPHLDVIDVFCVFCW